MADVLSVIADIIKQDKQQKREHAKVMREVQKKLKEKEADASEDVSDFMGAASQAAADGKKEFEFPPGSGKMYPVTIKDKDTAKKIAKKMDDKDEETSLSQRVKSRMKAEDEMPPKEEDEDDDPVGGEPSEDQIDKIADLVVQKLKDKADEEEDEEDEPEETEAEKGEEEEINTRPKMEAVRNPHARNTWEEALRKVYFKEEKVPEPIPEVIKNVGKELRNYAMKSGGIDRDDFLKISKTLMQGKMPKANMINKMDTDPREFVFDLMAKTMGWKYVEQYGGIRFQHRTDYVESFQGGHVLQEHCGECGAMDHVDEKFKKGKYTVRDGNTGKVIATYSSGEKASKEMHKLLDSGKYTDLEVKMEEVEIDEKMDGRKKFSGKQAKKDNEDRRAAQRKKLGILGPNEETINEADYELYHKTFSAAMQHAYAHAKKKGYIVDPDEIDNKVATGPKKPSSGKTNRYILGTNKKQKLHVQVANLDNKRFELNMYIEETEKENMNIKETIKKVIEDSDKGEPGTQGDDKEYQKKRDEVLKKYGVKSCALIKDVKKKKECFNALDAAHVADHEEQKESYQEAEISKKTNDDTTAIGFASKGVKKKAKEPQEETLLDKVKGMMKEKKYKK